MRRHRAVRGWQRPRTPSRGVDYEPPERHAATARLHRRNWRERPPRSCPRASTGQAAEAEGWAPHWGRNVAAWTRLFPIQTLGRRHCSARPAPASACRVSCSCTPRPPRESSRDTPHGLVPQACSDCLTNGYKHIGDLAPPPKRLKVQTINVSNFNPCALSV